MSAGYTRVTITSAERNVEMLLPSQRELDTLMPEILRMVEGPSYSTERPKALTLTSADMSSLLGHQSLQDAGIRDGSVLSLDRRDEAVPAPLVYDLAEQTENLAHNDVPEQHLDSTRITSAALFTVLLIGALITAVHAVKPQYPSLWSQDLSTAALIGLALTPRRRVAWDVEFLTLSAAALALTYYWGPAESTFHDWLLPAWAAGALICWQISRRHWWSVLITFSAAGLLTLSWWGTGQLLTEPEQLSATAGIASAVLLGFAPRLALMLSGMNSLDDRISGGERPRLARAETAFRNAHHGLIASVVLCALSLTLAVHGLLEQNPTVWTFPLACALTLLTALRARSMPLATERAALLTAAAISGMIIANTLTLWLPWWIPVTVAGVLASICLLLRLVGLPDHVAARLRLSARRLETLTALSLLPLLLGLFGLYSRLTATF